MLCTGIISISSGKWTCKWATKPCGVEEEKSSPFLSPHLALACHLGMTTLTIDIFYCHHFTRIIKLHFKFGVFVNSCGRKVSERSLQAEIFAWESHDYRYVTNVENSSKVTGDNRICESCNFACDPWTNLKCYKALRPSSNVERFMYRTSL